VRGKCEEIASKERNFSVESVKKVTCVSYVDDTYKPFSISLAINIAMIGRI
jgi:hypothetical protein